MRAPAPSSRPRKGAGAQGRGVPRNVHLDLLTTVAHPDAAVWAELSEIFMSAGSRPDREPRPQGCAGAYPPPAGAGLRGSGPAVSMMRPRRHVAGAPVHARV